MDPETGAVHWRPMLTVVGIPSTDRLNGADGKTDNVVVLTLADALIPVLALDVTIWNW